MLTATMFVLGLVLGGIAGMFLMALAGANRRAQLQLLYNEAQMECKALHESNTRLISRCAEAAMEIGRLKTEADGWHKEAIS